MRRRIESALAVELGDTACQRIPIERRERGGKSPLGGRMPAPAPPDGTVQGCEHRGVTSPHGSRGEPRQAGADEPRLGGGWIETPDARRAQREPTAAFIGDALPEGRGDGLIGALPALPRLVQ